MNVSFGRSLAATLVVGLVAGCGGSGGGSQYSGGSNTGSGSGVTGTCPTGVSDCSGATVSSRQGAITLTATGVQTITASTNDLLATPRQRGTDAQNAYGMLPLQQGLADVRVTRATDGVVTAVNLLLSGLGISWDGTNERPLIVETFALPRKRVQLGSQGMATFIDLPPATDTSFWNNNAATFAGTQANYANNIYYPRQPTTAQCASGDTVCIEAANNGLQLQRGDWKTGGVRPDQVGASRLHEDGEVTAPDNIPFPGYKGYRDFWNWNYQYANLLGWLTRDTVNIVEWGGTDEHNKERRGLVAFGKVTSASTIPATGSARYVGVARGWYSPDGAIQAYPIAADVEITVNFDSATRNAVVRVFNVRVDQNENPNPQLVAESTNTIPLGTQQDYFAGAMTHGSATGNLGARFFGPVSNGAPPEIAGTLSVRGSGGTAISGAIVGVAGFIAHRANQ